MNRFAVCCHRRRSAPGARGLVHERHEFIRNPRHRAADANPSDIRATAYPCHPTPFPHIALHNRPPASQLYDALNRAIFCRKFGLLVIAAPVASFMNCLTKQPCGPKSFIEWDHRGLPGSHVKQIEKRLHEVVWLNRTSRNAYNGNIGFRFPFPSEVIREAHTSSWISLHRMNPAVRCAGPSSHDGPGPRREAIDPVAGEDGLSGFLIRAKRRPVTLAFVFFVWDRSFDK